MAKKKILMAFKVFTTGKKSFKVKKSMITVWLAEKELRVLLIPRENQHDRPFHNFVASKTVELKKVTGDPEYLQKLLKL